MLVPGTLSGRTELMIQERSIRYTGLHIWLTNGTKNTNNICLSLLVSASTFYV
jgi:hypothetical protein